MSCSLAASTAQHAASPARSSTDTARSLAGDRRRHVVDDAAAASAGMSAGARLEQLLAGVELGQPQQILHQPLHPRGVALDDLEEALPAPRVVRVVEQRLDVAANGRERRAQLVRDVGDEVAADLVGALEVGDVVQHEHGAAAGGRPPAPAGPPDRGRRRGSTDSSKACGAPPASTPAEVLDDAGMADRLDVGAADGVALDAQHPAGGVVDQLQASGLVDDQHAFDHAAENRLHARPVARQRGRRGGPARAPRRRGRGRPRRGRRRRSRAPDAIRSPSA